MIKFRKNEIRDILIAFSVISLCVAILYSRRNFATIVYYLPMTMVGVGLGFILHEFAHKLTAIKYNYWAEFELSFLGLFLALLTSFLGFIFAAPGVVYIYGSHITKKEDGVISIAGPIINIILAIIFLLICTAIYPTLNISDQSSILIFITCSMGFGINSFLATFNLLPIMNLDGKTVLNWNSGIWFVTMAISIILTSSNMIYGTETIVRTLLGF